MGNIKFDMALPEVQIEYGRALRDGAPAWIAASTHEGEEDAAFTVHREVLKTFPNARLILVPRHPQRFDAVEKLIQKTTLSFQRRSELNGAVPSASVLLGDSMGEMFMYFSMADIAFVGGSLVPVGGHNVLEPAALGMPVLFGPQMHNFIAARDLLLETNAAEQVSDDVKLAYAVLALMRDPARAQAMGLAGQQAVAANRGALSKLLALIDAH
jgi:3-deoxy-D-manno-octulosonic-acid transferase